MGRWTTTKKKRWKRKGSWGPADEAWGGVAWWKPPLECVGFGVGGEEKRAGEERGRGGRGFEWRKRVGTLRRDRRQRVLGSGD